MLYLLPGGKIPKREHQKMLEVPIVCEAGRLRLVEGYVCEDDIHPTHQYQWLLEGVRGCEGDLSTLQLVNVRVIYIHWCQWLLGARECEVDIQPGADFGIKFISILWGDLKLTGDSDFVVTTITGDLCWDLRENLCFSKSPAPVTLHNNTCKRVIWKVLYSPGLEGIPL